MPQCEDKLGGLCVVYSARGSLLIQQCPLTVVGVACKMRCYILWILRTASSEKLLIIYTDEKKGAGGFLSL